MSCASVQSGLCVIVAAPVGAGVAYSVVCVGRSVGDADGGGCAITHVHTKSRTCTTARGVGPKALGARRRSAPPAPLAAIAHIQALSTLLCYPQANASS